MDQTDWSNSSVCHSQYQMGLELLGYCHIHKAGSRRCSDHAELRLAIECVVSVQKFVCVEKEERLLLQVCKT